MIDSKVIAIQGITTVSATPIGFRQYTMLFGCS